MDGSQGQEATKSVRVNLTIPAPVYEVLKRGAGLSGLSVSGFIASWLVFDLPSLRAWLRSYHNVRAGELTFEGDPIKPSVFQEETGLPLSAAQREDALHDQERQAREAHKLLKADQAQREALERERLARAGGRRAMSTARKEGTPNETRAERRRREREERKEQRS